ncbi:MAG: hypothetical protein DRQ78_07100 [Epsilonproteobacteria bacterium]|nr:MAG: hypothetical protein DRQ78_07100 [Campylobacterota bacterium]
MHKYLLLLSILSLSILHGEEELASSSGHGLAFLAPQNRWAVRIELRTNSYDTLFNNSGDKTKLGSQIDNAALDNQVFPILGLFGSNATLGTTHMNMDVNTQQYEVTLGYGLTKDFTLGAIIPFGKVKVNAHFSVSGGSVGFNPLYNPALTTGVGNLPFAPIGAGATPLGTEGVQTLLSNPIFGYAYKKLGYTETTGIGDPTIGAFWRVYEDSSSSFVLGAGLRLGLADLPDPDNLLAIPLGDSSNDIRLRMEYYRNLGNHFDLLLQVEHDIQLSDKIISRVPAIGELLAIESSKEKLSRNMGNYWEYDIGLGKSIGNWRLGATWHRYKKEADKYTSDIGTDTSALSENTSLYANQWKGSISWSGINAWKEGILPMPLIVELTVQETYEAKNFPKVRDIYFRITSFF